MLSRPATAFWNADSSFCDLAHMYDVVLVLLLLLLGTSPSVMLLGVAVVCVLVLAELLPLRSPLALTLLVLHFLLPPPPPLLPLLLLLLTGLTEQDASTCCSRGKPSSTLRNTFPAKRTGKVFSFVRKHICHLPKKQQIEYILRTTDPART